jgi:preprotein translocase subunit YajC
MEGLPSLIFFALFIGLLYFMMIRPQRRRMQQHRSLLDSLNEGDEVVTGSGLYGRVKRLGDEDIDLEVAPGTTLRFDKRAVIRRRNEDLTGASEEERA